MAALALAGVTVMLGAMMVSGTETVIVWTPLLIVIVPGNVPPPAAVRQATVAVGVMVIVDDWFGLPPVLLAWTVAQFAQPGMLRVAGETVNCGRKLPAAGLLSVKVCAPG